MVIFKLIKILEQSIFLFYITNTLHSSQSYDLVNKIFLFSEQPSSSSISTTTSSVTSMTSLEQEESKGNDSVSDYDYDHWDTENWGDMEVSLYSSNNVLRYFNIMESISNFFALS